MEFLVLGGSGAMGCVVVKDLANSPSVRKVIIGDIDAQRAKHIAEALKSKKVSFKHIDVRNKERLVDSIEDVDAVVNCTWYEFNLDVTRAAIEAKVDLVDLGGLFHVTRKQLELDEDARKAEVTVLLGCGAAPGITNVLARLGADKLDSVREVHIKTGPIVEGAFSLRTIIDELIMDPYIYQDGHLLPTKPFSGEEVVEMPKPAGRVKFHYTLHSEVATIPFCIDKGVKIVDVKTVFPRDFMNKYRPLLNMGLLNSQPMVEVKGLKISPRDFIVKFLSLRQPEEAESKIDYSIKRVEVSGEKDGEKRSIVYDVETEEHRIWGVSIIAFLTGVSASIGAQMVAGGSIKTKGVIPPEKVINPSLFLKELSKRNIKVRESIVCS